MPVIDKTTFEELKQICGAGFINELIDAFLDDAPQMISAMETALAAGDTESFRRNAHSLKSNASTFGATALAELAKELEMIARGNNLEVGNKLEALRNTFLTVAQELEALRV